LTRDDIEQVFRVAYTAAKANIYVQQWQKEFPKLQGELVPEKERAVESAKDSRDAQEGNDVDPWPY